MCGIAGIFNFKQDSSDPAAVRRMTDAMAHRGPDATGYYSDGSVSLGHLRLSIIDLSTAANQPFEDNSGRYHIVFNGEIYNYQSVRSLLTDYTFNTNGDTEVIIAAYAKWGPACLEHFRGMFAFAIWDRQEKELFIARDRMGVKPLYYYKDGDRLVFASELRAILASGLMPRKLDRRALVEYFTYQSVSYPFSPVEGILQLEAGSWIKTRNGQLEKRVYWDVTASPMDLDFDFSDKAGVQGRIRQLMLQSIERRLVSDVPVGAFLSGGIDSSAVVGLMAEAGSSRPNTFNIAFQEEEYDESGYAELIAKKFNTAHTKILLRPTVFLDELRSALDAMDTPSGDGINTYVVSKAIREKGVTVALSGAGGDELFAGYPFFGTYLQLQARKGFWKVLPGGVREAAAGLLLGSNAGGRKARLRQLIELASVTIDEVYPVFRQILSPALLEELTTLADAGGASGPVGSGAGPGETGHTAVERILSEKREQLARLPLLSQVSAAEYLGYTQHTLLKDTDQMSMAVSLEVREPFFDQDLVEFVLAVPDRWKKPEYPKSLLVESLKPMLPEEIVFRKKQGFLFPWDHWLRQDLKSFADQHIRRMAERSFISGDQLIRYWERFLAGDGNVRWAELWLFIVLEYWLEKNNIEC